MSGRWRGVYLRGMAMGAVETVPGVSSGTLALITGIYEELILTLGGIRPSLLRIWREQGFKAFWRASNLGFLLVLLAGMLTSIVPAARLIIWVMERWPVPLWAFFCGLILVGIVVVLRPLAMRRLRNWCWVAVGLTIGVWVSLQPGLGALGLTPVVFFLSGALAICAMLLPGISGTFVLLLLGMYAPVLQALNSFDLPLIAAFAAGCACGMLGFVHLLRWLLLHYHDVVMALAAGFMAGSLVKLWPWRVAVPGETVAEQWLTPAGYSMATGEPAMLPAAIIAATAAALLVWLFSGRDRHNQENPASGTVNS